MAEDWQVEELIESRQLIQRLNVKIKTLTDACKAAIIYIEDGAPVTAKDRLNKALDTTDGRRKKRDA